MFGVFHIAKARKETVEALRRFIVRPEKFAPWPPEFWRDPFVLGFFIAVSALIGRRVAGGKLTAERRSRVMRMALEEIGASPGFFDDAIRFGSERDPDYLLGARNAQTVITYIQNLHPMPGDPDVSAATELAKAQTPTGEADRGEIGKALINRLFHEVARKRLKLRWDKAEATVRARLVERDQALIYEVIVKYEASLAIEPENADTLGKLGAALAGLAELKGDEALFREAINKYEAALSIEPNMPFVLNNLGGCILSLRRFKKDAALLDRAREVLDRHEALDRSQPYNRACLAAIQGDEEGCRERLARAKEFGALPPAEHLKSDPDLENMRDKPWFRPYLNA